jgi:hypothetical protein
MDMQRLLKSLSPTNWTVGQVIVFDWFNGPRQGVARMENPECEFAFELLAERYNPDGLDDRLFRISELPRGSVTKILDTLQSSGRPAHVVWVPVWKFGSEEERLRADQEIERILSQQKGTDLAIHSRDMVTFLGCWQVDVRSNQVQDWFSFLDIS